MALARNVVIRYAIKNSLYLLTSPSEYLSVSTRPIPPTEIWLTK